MLEFKKKVLCIGGSPCAGKSTVAERISKEYGAYYFKVDDYIDGKKRKKHFRVG